MYVEYYLFKRRIFFQVFKHEGRVNDQIKWRKEHNIDKSSDLVSKDSPLSTFKLTLSESEKKARDAVVLPYERYAPYFLQKDFNLRIYFIMK